MQEIDDLADGGQRPGEDVQEIQRGDRAEVGEHRIDPQDAEQTGARNNDRCRDDGFPESARGGNGAVHKGGDTIGERHDGETLHTGIDDVGVSREEG